MGRGGGCGRWDGMGERKLMGAQECGQKSRIEPRLDFGGLPRSFYRDYVPPKRLFANRSLTILVRSNPAKRKMELSGKNRGSKTRAALSPSRPASPLSTGFITIDWLHHDRRDARKRLHAVESGVFVFFAKGQNLIVAGFKATTNRFSALKTDRYGIGHTANRGGRAYRQHGRPYRQHGFLSRMSLYRQFLG